VASVWQADRVIAVFFDGDQTLWDFQALMRRTLRSTIDELLRRHGPIDGDTSVEAFVSDREFITRESAGRVTNLEQLRFRAFARSLARLGIADPGDALADYLNTHYLERRWAGVHLFDDALPTLSTLPELPGGCRIGLLSNGNSYPDRVGLGRYFDTVVFSQDVGVEKPDPGIYAHAQQELAADRYVMVGDSLANDVTGAQQSGWHGIWLNRNADPFPAQACPDLTVTSLAEVVPWVAALAS
jgi:FMN hydrolase / 5-amino-6-(5-phospho-D-ribitylamino)uracil phosphatase